MSSVAKEGGERVVFVGLSKILLGVDLRRDVSERSRWPLAQLAAIDKRPHGEVAPGTGGDRTADYLPKHQPHE